MKPSDYYESILKELTDNGERRVFEILSRHLGLFKSRQKIIFEMYGEFVPEKELSASKSDRKVRKYIESLRLKGYPIVSTSGESGYALIDKPELIDQYIAEERSRISKIQAKIEGLLSSRKRAAMLHEWGKTADLIVQERMF